MLIGFLQQINLPFRSGPTTREAAVHASNAPTTPRAAATSRYATPRPADPQALPCRRCARALRTCYEAEGRGSACAECAARGHRCLPLPYIALNAARGWMADRSADSGSLLRDALSFANAAKRLLASGLIEQEFAATVAQAARPVPRFGAGGAASAGPPPSADAALRGEVSRLEARISALERSPRPVCPPGSHVARALPDEEVETSEFSLGEGEEDDDD
ncbi:hypothetical protein GGS23DRAFT_601254 [Durotheca rogersii]|uniref:uncharacterized protein n=1 Tax=Durotheca rogersii TaxID=419775 RepID=UPI00221F452E|nr:uncharacterized protein GGS23DRAFT_601254 [Durotheca rogersii]KAI5856143.1 hypothetical protein GGS23DRAFT_601254 [Durotheca rogersii]